MTVMHHPGQYNGTVSLPTTSSSYVLMQCIIQCNNADAALSMWCNGCTDDALTFNYNKLCIPLRQMTWP